ncbi:PH domain-containing protein [Antrihabitans sp. YC2-6]|uniref:PH domain-containing protein n=1 Tax=Antrihabitans sp. YC2-6 TaxID=2799498 RepID=UPI0018F5C8DC|nr:PH domain-containing protein [Antrihabitans sp. YC2-6]MBJ8345332.1 PH domain-containing protein [Antrihabitans sp. YC2-6]
MTYELEIRPKRSTRYAIGTAVFLVLAFAIIALLLRNSDTGVYFTVADQVAMVLLGFGLAGIALLFTRPRLRANDSGVWVRNVAGEKRIDWDLIQGLSFPDGAAWARIELPDDEYIPVMAIQANDRGLAVDAVRSFRVLGDKYASAES